MAKVRRPAQKSASKWPSGAELKPWLECYLRLCEAHPQPEKVGTDAAIRLKQLAECGDSAGALRQLDRLLAKLPKSESAATAWLALAGATICLEIPDEARAARYIQLAESRQSAAKPAMRYAIKINLDKLRTANDLPLPEGVVPLADEELAALGKQRRLYREALVAKTPDAAAKALRKITKLIPEIDDFLAHRGLILSVLRGYHRLGLDKELSKYVATIDRTGDGNDLDSGAILSMGLPEVANHRAESRIQAHLKQLKSRQDSNVHFPVDEICRELWFLLLTGEKALATKLLRKTLRELPNWPGLSGGFASSGALTQLAEVLAEIDGPDAARELLGVATTAAQVESHRGFRRSAVKAAEAPLPTPGLAAAIAAAQTIKNAAKRQEALLPLLTRAGEWKALAELLDNLTTPAARCQAVYTILYQLPGGPRLS